MERKIVNKPTLLTLTLGSLLSLSPLLHAGEDYDSGITISPAIGIIQPEDKRHLEQGVSSSIGLGYQFANPWALELTYLQADLDSEQNNDSLDYSQYRIDALYDFTKHGRLTPYGVFGIGNGEFDYRGQSNKDSLLNAGLGLKYSLTQALSLRSDLRLIKFTEADATDIGFNFGLSYLFGNSSSKPRPTKSTPTDTDQDGIQDSKDACPNSPAGAKVDSNGCTINNDLDNDGVPNAQDKCPDTKAGAKVQADGCYEILKEDVSITLNVTFGNNSDEVVPGSEKQIENLASFMKNYPQTDVLIRGYTDDRGSADYNQQLSQKRADKVAKILVDQYDVEANRIQSKGYGEQNPIANNDTSEGRSKNRRVEALVKATKETVNQ